MLLSHCQWFALIAHLNGRAPLRFIGLLNFAVALRDNYTNTACAQDELQIPSTLRPKLATMDPTVKAAFLKSSHVLAQMKPAPTAPLTPRTLRRVHSSESMLSSPRPQKPSLEEYDLTETPLIPMAFGTNHSRGKSLDVRRQAMEPKPAPIAPLKVSKDKKKSSTTTPEKYVNILLSHSSTNMDIEVIKKLRLLLRNESARYDRRSRMTSLSHDIIAGRKPSSNMADLMLFSLA